MAETRTIHDPFLNKPATISTRLVDRLRGKYAVGPTLPNGEPEFGWRQHETPAIQREAADEIERLQASLKPFSDALTSAEKAEPSDPAMRLTDCRDRLTLYEFWKAREAMEK